jgi:erythromycin esterase-like protein
MTQILGFTGGAVGAFAATVVLTLHAAGCSDSAPAPALPLDDAGSEASAEVRLPPPSEDGTYDLAGLDRALPHDDLAPIGRLAQDASVIAFGESIHTSGGFYQAKVRVLEYLVAKQDVRVIAFETPWANADVANEYVQTCAGSPEEAARRLHMIWWDESVAELLAWLCNWNANHATDRVVFMGFDIRQPWTDGPALRSFFEAAAPPDASALMDGLSTCLGMGYADERAFFSDPKVLAIYEGTPMPTSDHDACVAGVANASKHLATLETKVARSDWDIARLRVTAIGAFDETIYRLFSERSKAQTARDAAMFDVFTTLRGQRFADKKVGVWAHNLHITRKNPEIDEASYPGAITFGTLLDRELGERYVPIGLIGHAVGTNWMDGPQVQAFGTKGSLERALHDAKRKLTFVDLVTPVEAPFVRKSEVLSVSGEKMIPAQHYAGVIFVDAPEGARYIGGTSPFAR